MAEWIVSDKKSPLGYEYIDIVRRKELIRCKDCIHYRYYGLTYETVSECRIDHCENPDKEWFCADGEKEDAEM